jgi:hypothetical protein
MKGANFLAISNFALPETSGPLSEFGKFVARKKDLLGQREQSTKRTNETEHGDRAVNVLS